MTTTQNHNTHWIDAWLETQQGWIGRWQSLAAEQRLEATRVAMETWREQFNAGASAEFMNILSSFHTLLQSSMAASGEWARLQQQMQDSLPWSQWPLGPQREHQERWQRYVQAQQQAQLAQSALMGRLSAVLAQSLQAVPQQVAARAEAGKPVTGFRELYDLWVECGEQVFAAQARDPQFIAAQSACANADAQLKRAQQALIEQWLKHYDLPTRSELNSVHRLLREQQQRIAELEQALSHQAAQQS